MKKTVDEKLFIELYNLGKTDYEMSQLLGKAERTIGSIAQRLRAKKKIKPRKELQLVNKLSLDKPYNDVKKKIDSLKKEWIIPPASKSKKSNEDFKIYLYTADQHVPEYNIPANRAIHKLMEDIKFDGFRIVGDYMDMSPISHWNEHRRKTLETQRLKEHYTFGNVLLDEYGKRLPKNCDKGYFWGNHESVFFGSDVLTSKGWKNVAKVTYNDQVGQFDINTGEISFAQPIALHKHFSKSMIEITSDYSSQNVTLNHDVVIGNQKIKARQLLNKEINARQLRITGNFNQKKIVKLNNYELELLTWIICDGTMLRCDTPNKYRIQFKLSKQRKIDNLRKLLDSNNIKYTFRKAVKSGLNKLQPYYICIYGFNAKKFYLYLNEKKSFPETWKNLTKKQFEKVLTSIANTDSSQRLSKRYTWSTINKNDYNIILFLCVKHGIIFSEVMHDRIGGFVNSKKQYGLNFYLNNKDYNYRNNKVKVKKIKYNNYAYCFTMPKNTIIIKYKGKVAFTGNCWYNDLIEKMPVLDGMLNPTEELYLKKRGYKVYEKINYIERIGRLSVTHGVYANVHAVKKHIDSFKTNVMFFHTHRIGSRSEKAPGKEIAIIGYNVGCLCNKSPDYLKNKPDAWSHGFAIVYYMSNGYFFVDNIRIIQGRFIYNGKIYDGNKK